MEDIENLNSIERSILVNEDPVTCANYFNKVVNVLMKNFNVQERKNHHLGNMHNFITLLQTIEFQHRGSPHEHILL